jgi:hypothetical protein
MAGSVEGEITSQAIGDTGIHTGAKYFGGRVPVTSGNPNFIAANNLKIVGLVVGGLIAALFVYKKVK